jgi:surfeit locus 1 family protein
MVVTASQVGLSLPGKLFFGGLTAGTFVLGCWQTRRYFEKIALIERRQKELRQEPLPLENDLLENSKRSEELQQKQLQKDFRRRFVTGIFRHDEEMYVGLRGPPIGALASSGPASGKSQGGMSSGPQVRL